jgi:tetratricopeptide (TPR) repeat protein
LVGDDAAAEKQFAAFREISERDLGGVPGPAVEMAMREARHEAEPAADEASVEAIIEAGSAAVSAGATEAGVESLRTAVRLADGADVPHLRVASRLVLAEALIHSLRGFDEEGLAWLHEADEIALAHDNPDAVAQARSEIGYVDFLRARYDRAEIWLNDAARFADESPSMMAKASAYLGSVESDRANYESALAFLDQAVRLARTVNDPRRESYARSMLGRLHLLRGDLDRAVRDLDGSIDLAERHHWLAFLPWPQAILGEVQLARSDLSGAAELLEQAFARACQLGDPCWESMAARGLALVAEVSGETDEAFTILADSRARGSRLADPYVWLDAYVLDAQCELGRRHDHPELRLWVDTMRELTSRTGMRELTVRSLLHGAALGNVGDADAAALLAADIDNPRLDLLFALAPGRPVGQD